MKNSHELIEVETYSADDPIVVVKVLSTRVSFPEVPQIKKEILKVSRVNPVKVILDLKRVNYLDSAALGMLFQVQSRFAKTSIELCLANINRTIQTVLSLTKSDKLLSVYKSVEDALRQTNV
ncbi:MAG: anti-sigma factor antagonist [Candidatus Hydrogenedentota bacterium]|nr:MAG: anti-sigma factor antagonist [Candidatus Hydrogenedentota bacterium]